MSIQEGTASAVIEAFAQRGFHYNSRSPTGHFVLSGCLQTPDGSYECEVRLRSDFSTPPAIRLLTIPDELKPIAPHVNGYGDICYLSKSSVALNIFDPVGQMLACLERAEKVLGQILRHELVEDLAEEFFAYWGNLSEYCLFDIRNYNSNDLKCMAIKQENHLGPIFFVTDDVLRTTKKSKALGYDAVEVTCPVSRIYTHATPRPLLGKWPLETLSDLLAWQSLLEPRVSRRIAERVAQAAEKGNRGILIMIHSPKFQYAIAVRFAAPNCRFFSKTELRRKSVLENSEVIPLIGWRIDEQYIIKRNIPNMKTLESKKIVLVGCGTIGGYLSDMLVKAGAGAGNGELLLIDHDILSTSNVGRHRLGFPYVGQKKAVALMEELKSCMPDANIRAMSIDVRLMELKKTDLIIDATGEQTISDFLAKTYGKNAQLSIWIEGPGIAVRGLLRPRIGSACYHCLTMHNRDGKYLSTNEFLPQLYEGQGCEQEYVPFPATVSIHAACLACEMVLDWVAMKNTSTLRTRVLDRTFSAATPDCVPESLPECPACRT